MTEFVLPAWYRAMGRILTPISKVVGSPRTGPWNAVPPGRAWIHAASIGEIKGVLRLVEALPSDLPLFLTSTTRSGLESLERHLPQHPRSLLPLDSPSVATDFLDSVRPSCAVFFESEAWPGLLCALDARRVPVAFAALRTGEASMRRWKRLLRIFPGWTKSVTTLWTDGIAPIGSVRTLGVSDVRTGRSLKWAGWDFPDKAPRSERRAAMSIHLRDLPEVVGMLRAGKEFGWLLFPRRLWLGLPLRLLAGWIGLRQTDTPSPGAGEVWIAPRFGMVRDLLPDCAWTWVSEGHDVEEPYMLGALEVWTGSPRRKVDRPGAAADRTRTEIVAWMLEQDSVARRQKADRFPLGSG